MKVTRREAVAGGWMFKIEVPNAYTDGSSRYDSVFVSAAELKGKSPDQAQQAILDAMEVPDVRGELTAPAATKEILEDRMEARYEVWQRWKATKAEAVARSLPAAVVTALTNRENAAWAAYLDVIQQWRAAP